MQRISIEWLVDTVSCDHDGCSGGYSTGAVVKLDDEVIIHLAPVASCFEGESWDDEEVYCRLFKHLGYKLEAV